MSDKTLRWLFMILWIVVLNLVNELGDTRMPVFIVCFIGVGAGEGTLVILRSLRKQKTEKNEGPKSSECDEFKSS